MKTKIQKVIYPGTFDPVTIGHLDIIKRSARLFDSVVVAVSNSKDKSPMFSAKQRVEMLKLATKKIKRVKVKSFDTLLVDFLKQEKASTIIRGIRTNSDFEFEMQLTYANKSLYKNIDTIFLTPNIKHTFISSSIIRSILKHKGDINHLVPKEILKNVYNT